MCKTPFHNQVGSRNFMNVLVRLLEVKELDKEVMKKILSVIQKWAKKFEKQKDVFPVFQEVYQKLKDLEMPFEGEIIKYHLC